VLPDKGGPSRPLPALDLRRAKPGGPARYLDPAERSDGGARPGRVGVRKRDDRVGVRRPEDRTDLPPFLADSPGAGDRGLLLPRALRLHPRRRYLRLGNLSLTAYEAMHPAQKVSGSVNSEGSREPVAQPDRSGRLDSCRALPFQVWWVCSLIGFLGGTAANRPGRRLNQLTGGTSQLRRRERREDQVYRASKSWHRIRGAVDIVSKDRLRSRFVSHVTAGALKVAGEVGWLGFESNCPIRRAAHLT
jgi:hypothetical protein